MKIFISSIIEKHSASFLIFIIFMMIPIALAVLLATDPLVSET
jgi:hypothetical protein